MCVWMKPGSTYPPRASMVLSNEPPAMVPTPAMRPSRIAISPSTTSERSFIVTTTALRISTDDKGAEQKKRLVPDVHAFHRGRARLDAAADGNHLGDDADRDFRRRHGADGEPDRRAHACQAFRRHAL